jgi:hypothetical protein
MVTVIAGAAVVGPVIAVAAVVGLSVWLARWVRLGCSAAIAAHRADNVRLAEVIRSDARATR